MDPEPTLEAETENPAKELETPVVEQEEVKENVTFPLAEEDEGVGHVMVEGVEEAKTELEDKVDEIDTKEMEALQPQVLDKEVAEAVSKEEVRESLPESTPVPADASLPVPEPQSVSSSRVESRSPAPGPSRSPPRSRSPLPPTQDHSATQSAVKRSRTPNDDGLPEVERSSAPNKRSRDEEDVPPPKRSRPVHGTALPRSLSHLHHPPTCTLYITNLRRPLLIPALHDYLLPAMHPASVLPVPKGPFATDDCPGLWLSGVKDHAYATYPSVEDALETAERIEGVTWPEETGSKLSVEFIPDDKVRDLVEREEFAWANGRQKLSLNITGEGDDTRFEFVAGGLIGRGGSGGLARGRGIDTGPPGRGAPGIPLTGTNAIGNAPPGAPSGPSRGIGIRGRGGFGLPAMGRDLEGQSRFSGLSKGAEGRLANPMKKTVARPPLFYREGPGVEQR